MLLYYPHIPLSSPFRQPIQSKSPNKTIIYCKHSNTGLRHKETYLSEEITEGPANKGSEGLGSEGLLVEGLVVGGPAGDGTAAGGRGVAEESTLLGGARRTLEGVGEGGLGQRALRNALLDRRGGLGDAEGRGGDEEGGNEDGGELHLSRFILVVWTRVFKK